MARGVEQACGEEEPHSHRTTVMASHVEPQPWASSRRNEAAERHIVPNREHYNVALSSVTAPDVPGGVCLYASEDVRCEEYLHQKVSLYDRYSSWPGRVPQERGTGGSSFCRCVGPSHVWLRELTVTSPAVASVSWLVWDTLVHLGDEVSPIAVPPHRTDLVHG